ncbi:hypothetical protein FSP39_024467 [Pinctada imbricata]|uniref:CCHC-type domain-containing protein n=1 Tax=Pinctada imbricata TaxID=66713 RepID=A0AA88XLH7_PINIB|nr:hypothetical protein FSP39_024467 [Pinctada imbricata]
MAAIRPHPHPGRTFAKVVSDTIDNVGKTTKPVFIKETDIFGFEKPPKESWITHVEIYKSISQHIESECIAGIQRVHRFWRIYLDNDESRTEILDKGIVLRNKTITVYNNNPGRLYLQDENSTRIRVKNVPLSADDGQIRRALSIRGCNITTLFREKLRVDGKLTNCETGDRIVIVKDLEIHIPKTLEIGRYRAQINYKGQPNDKLKCSKCMEIGHTAKECTNDIVCRNCYMSGHKAADCQEPLSQGEDETDDFGEDVSDDIDTCEESAHESENDLDAETQNTANQPQTSDTAKQTSNQTGDPAGEKNQKSDETRQKKTTNRKQAKKVKTTTENCGTIDKYVVSINTPARKSTDIPTEERSPVTPTNELQANAKKKPRAATTNK